MNAQKSKLEDVKHEVVDMRSIVKDRIEQGKRCVQARKDSDKIFASAKSTLSGQHPVVKELGSELQSHWDKEKEAHDKQTETIERDVVGVCEKLLD
jgi:hypothetical protein